MRTKFYFLMLITLPVFGVSFEKSNFSDPTWGNFGYYYLVNERIDELYFYGVINRWERRNLLNDLITIRRFEIRSMRDGFISFSERNRLNQLRRRLEFRLRQLEQRLLFFPFGNGYWDDDFGWNHGWNNGWDDDFDSNWNSPWGDGFGYKKGDNNKSLEKSRSGDSIQLRGNSSKNLGEKQSISTDEVQKRKAEIQHEDKIDWENLK